MANTTATSEHLRPLDITAFVRRGPGPLEDPRVAHLADCSECRREVLEVSRLLRQPALTRVKAGGAIAAAAAIIVAAWLGLRSEPSEIDQERATPVAPAGAVRLISPIGPTGRDAPLTFSWHTVGNAVEYRLTLLDARGNMIWSSVTTDTVAALPIETSLVRGPSYYWYVDVLQSDGSSATSGSREFRSDR